MDSREQGLLVRGTPAREVTPMRARRRRQGRGSVVAGPKLEQPLSLASCTEGVRRQNRRPGRNLIGLDRFPCPAALAADVGVRTGEPVWHLERVLLADDERVGLESTYVAVSRVPRLGVDFEPDSSFYSYVREVVGVPFGDADERIETVLATPREALLIGTRGITVNNIQPGPTDTEGNPADGPNAAALLGWMALDRFGTPEEIAALTFCLADPEAAFVTGASLNIDGGFTA
ncbi:SDR family oxidoreductase [Streptomyces sp. NPDC088261]|uniref:SDR family oxidoreductase n=1 Tax=Streptomyces sp. NPDC088261 TaxID=3365851 RepID=UPI0038115E3D